MGPLKATIRFDSDFRVGAGWGIPGMVDNTVIRTQERLPYIPGATIKGNVRNSCEEICRVLGLALPRDDEPEADTPVARIFGTPFVPAGFVFGSAYLADEASSKDFLRHFIRVERNNRIDARTGTAMEDHFYSSETAWKSLEFEFEIAESHLFEGTLEEKDMALLVASLRYTDRIGAGKSRGRGKCRIEIEDGTWEEKTVEQWLDLAFENSSEKGALR